jgi:hypothetical protein
LKFLPSFLSSFLFSFLLFDGNGRQLGKMVKQGKEMKGVQISKFAALGKYDVMAGASLEVYQDD